MILPDPPPDSCFIADVDEQGRPRLTWGRPLGLSNYIPLFLFTAAVGCGLVFVLGRLTQHWAGPGRIRIGDLPAYAAFVWFLGVTFIVTARELGRNLLFGPTPRRISFGPDALHFDPALLYQPLKPPVEQVSRSELGAIRLKRLAGRQLLTIDRGIWRVKVGTGLADWEQEWLAGVLRAWAGPPGRDCSAALRPPDGSCIRVEGEAGVWRLSWLPPVRPLFQALARWDIILGLAASLVPLGILIIVLKVFCAGVLVRQFAGGWNWPTLILLALPVLFLTSLTQTVRWMFGQIRQLLAKTRPETLTLTPATLTYDPGNFIRRTPSGRYAVSVGEPRTVPWAEIADGCLSLTEGRLALTHGQEELAIGKCLREPEREWLAEVLRTWMRKSGP